MASEVVGKKGDVLAALAKGWEVQLHHVETEIEVLAEFSFRHHLGQIAVGRGHESHVGVDRLVASHALENALAQNAQDFHLRGGVNFADFVEKERSARRLLEECGAMHGDERTAAARTELVDGVRGEFFACAAFARDQHGGARRGDLSDGFEHAFDGGGVADESFEAEFFVDLLAQPRVLPLDLRTVQRALHQQVEAVDIDRLGHKVISAVLHRLDRVLDASVGCHHDADRRMLLALRPRHQVHAAFAAQAQVG
jgi:hypothetical protein